MYGVVLPCVAKASTQSTTACDALQNATPQQYLAYLDHDRSTLKSDCIETALNQLGQLRYLPAIPILIQYLDFKTSSPLRSGGKALGGAYPGATALDRIGALCIPDVKAAVSNESLNTTQRRNAAALYAGSLSQDLPGNIAFLMHASKEVKDQQLALDLVDMATRIAKACPADTQQRCYDLLNGK